MSAKCRNCGTLREKNLVSCPNCKEVYTDSEHVAERVAGSQLTLEVGRQVARQLSEQEARMYKRVRRTFWKSIVGGMSFMGAVFGLGLWQMYGYAKKIATDEIKKEFSEPNIRQTFTEVASQQAKDLMSAQLQPEIVRAKEDLAHQVTWVRSLSVRIHIVLQGEWTGVPHVTGFLTAVPPIRQPVNIVLASGESKSLDLIPNNYGLGDYKRLDDRQITYEILAEAESDSWVMGLDPSTFVGCENMNFQLPSLTKSSTKDSRFQIVSLQFRFAINGKALFTCSAASSILLSPSDNNGTSLSWPGRVPREPIP